MGTLKLSSTTAANVTTLQNAVNLNGADRTIFVDDNPNSTADYAVMSGGISGAAGIVKTGTGLLKLTGTNNYTGTTTISGGVLQANLGTGLPSSSYLVLDGGVLQNTTTSFTRSLGTTQSGSYFEWTANGGGFSPSGSALTVNIGGRRPHVDLGFHARHEHHGTLKLGSATATANVTFQNGLDLGGGTQTIEADGNYSAYLTGAISDARGSLIKTGTGTLYLTGSLANTYTGSTTIIGGNVYLNRTHPPAMRFPATCTLGGSTQMFVNIQGSNQIAPTSKWTWIGMGAWQEVKLLATARPWRACRTLPAAAQLKTPRTNPAMPPSRSRSTIPRIVHSPATCAIPASGSAGAISMVKTGTGTQTLAGGNIIYTGSTTISKDTRITGHHQCLTACRETSPIMERWASMPWIPHSLSPASSAAPAR